MRRILHIDEDREIEIGFGKRHVVTHFREKSHPKVKSRYRVTIHELLTDEEVEKAVKRACYDFHAIWDGKTRRPHTLFIMLLMIELAKIAGQRLYRLDVRISFFDSKDREKLVKMNNLLKRSYQYVKNIDNVPDDEKERNADRNCEEIDRRKKQNGGSGG